jgi:hypothetical protein
MGRVCYQKVKRLDNFESLISGLLARTINMRDFLLDRGTDLPSRTSFHRSNPGSKSVKNIYQLSIFPSNHSPKYLSDATIKVSCYIYFQCC